jgi:hypothetical protein
VEVEGGFDPLDAASNPGTVPIEVGRVTVDHSWKTVKLSRAFADPVVVAKPASLNGAQPGMLRLRRVTPASFEVRLQEWDYLDGWHARETVSYLAVERGRWVLPDGTEIEADTARVTGTVSRTGGGFSQVTFTSPFRSVPLVFSVVASANGPDAVATRHAALGPTGFRLGMQEQENKGGHTAETIHWIAWSPGIGTLADGTPYEADEAAGVNHRFARLDFVGAFTGNPCLVADMQTFNGPDPANLRYRDLGPSGVRLRVTEEQSLDPETNHVMERVGYLVFGCR